MARRRREIEPGEAHHITQRGNNRQPVFLDRVDHLRYLSLLNGSLKERDILCLAYCLMPNHAHLILIPPDKESLALAMDKAQSTYAMAFNRKYGRSGHLWQNRYYSCAMDESHLFQAFRYVELNPVRAGMVPVAWEYEWSSAALHMGIVGNTQGITVSSWSRSKDIGPWGVYLAGPDSENDRETIRSRTARGYRWDA